LSLDLPRARAMRTQAAQLQAIYQVLSKAGGSLDLREVLDAITRLTVEVTGVRGCSIKLLDSAAGGSHDGNGEASPSARGHDTMRVRSLAGIQREVSDLAVEAAESIYTRSLLDGQPVRVEGAQVSDFPELDDEVESLICVPLRREGKVVGALCLYGEKGKSLSPEMLPFLSRLGDLVTISIQNASVYESLKRIDEAKTWFLLKASHELKSPLASIQSICQTILDGYLGEVVEKQRELIERIRFRSSLLLETANDLLVLARTRSRSPGEALEPVEPCAVLEETVRFFQAVAKEKGIELQITKPCEPIVVSATQEGIRSVMSNLISNALKYSSSGSAVSVTLERSGGMALFSVSDSGIGIPASEQERLFREFFRASNARSLTESGTGLGLTIVKSVVDQLGGSIQVRSEEGKGTTVTVLLGKSG
jgi:two-component sensor histidine kinase